MKIFRENKEIGYMLGSEEICFIRGRRDFQKSRKETFDWLLTAFVFQWILFTGQTIVLFHGVNRNII